MLWRKAGGTEVLYEKRPYLYELPVLRQDISSYLSYPCSDELAVSLSLCDMGKFFNAHNWDDMKIYHYPELLAKRLPWFVKHLCERTDMASCGVSLKVGITSDIHDLVMSYLQACNFPMDAVDWIENCEDEWRWISKYESMKHPTLSHIKRVLHMDLSFLIGTHRTQRELPLFSDILSRWDNEPIASASNGLFYYRGVEDAIAIPRVEHIGNERDNPKSHVIWEEITSLYGGTVDAVYEFWTTVDPFPHVPGGVIGHSQGYLSDEEKYGRFKRLLKGSCNDEVALSLSVHYENLEHSDIAMIHDSFPWCGYPYESDPYGVYSFCTCEERMPKELFLDMHY